MKPEIGIGIDLGGTSLKYSLGNANGEILVQKQRPSHAQSAKSKILSVMKVAIAEMLTYASSKKLKPSVIGIGTPGSIDVSKGLLKGSTPNFKYWKDVPISDEIESEFNLPTFVDNDANLMALAEARHGAGREYKNLICLTIGTGIGGGIIINGELYRGSFYGGAELGHMTIKHNGLKCRCGGQGCLEKYASASAMIREYKSRMSAMGKSLILSDLSVKQIFREFKSGNQIAQYAVEKSTYYLGRGVANFINIFNPEIVILGGGVADAGSLYIKKVEEIAFKYAMQNSSQEVKIVKAKLGNRAGAIGAIIHAFESLSGNEK